MTSPNRQDWLKLLDVVAREDQDLKVPDDVFKRVMSAWADGGAASGRVTGSRDAWRVGLWLAAAAAAIALVVTPWQQAEWIATVEAADGSRSMLPPNALLRAGNGGTTLTLADESRIEMRAQSALSVERATDGLRIHLHAGGLIVNAAKQDGRLYVRTRDMEVAVVGTIFVVNAEESGSRVTVLEGEVRVQEGDVKTSLRPGEQIATNPLLAARSVKEEVGWSRNADAILKAFLKGVADTAGLLQPVPQAPRSEASGLQDRPGAAAAIPEFAEASIRRCDPHHLPQKPDGARGGGAGSLQITRDRLNALCMTMATLIRIAHGYGRLERDIEGRGGAMLPAEFRRIDGFSPEDGGRVRGGPEWLRSEFYTVSAIADRSATPTAGTLQGPMLRRLLERRLKLEARIESENVPGYALEVANGGLKIKPVSSEDCEPLTGRLGQPLQYGYPTSALTPPRTVAAVRGGEKPSCGVWGDRIGPNVAILGGDVPLQALAAPLGFRLATRVLDRTGVADRFNFVLEFMLDENTPGRSIFVPGGMPFDPRESLDVPRAPTIFTALEEQLGLRLERAEVPRQFIVIDKVERPSPD